MTMHKVNSDRDVRPTGKKILAKHPNQRDKVSLCDPRGKWILHMAEARFEVLHHNNQRHKTCTSSGTIPPLMPFPLEVGALLSC